ncbi:MAG: site-2 protease family protein [Acidobacteria bacterium]|nr:site-2 protease family protein [Acidobacteriota bacterium]|tara:strand:- start:2020 stop:2661 length:642 start_codon:yes stop_codon:yes gene_type:complete
MNYGDIVLQVGVLLFALSFHEMAHAWAAYRLGDTTAKDEGRLTMNPIVHVDPIMTVLFPAILILVGSPVVFGAAKPVPVNTWNLRNPKRDHMWIAAAGPASNVILATVSIVLVNIVWRPLQIADAMGQDWAGMIAQVLFLCVGINLVLATFNMIPIHPLDGSWILSRFLSGNMETAYATLRPYGFLILIFLMYTGVLWEFINPVMRFASMFLP